MRASPASAASTASRIALGRCAGQEPETTELHAEKRDLDVPEGVERLEYRAVTAERDREFRLAKLARRHAERREPARLRVSQRHHGVETGRREPRAEFDGRRDCGRDSPCWARSGPTRLASQCFVGRLDHGRRGDLRGRSLRSGPQPELDVTLRASDGRVVETANDQPALARRDLRRVENLGVNRRISHDTLLSHARLTGFELGFDQGEQVAASGPGARAGAASPCGVR